MTIFSDFLTALKVPHTTDYSDKAFASMPFRTLFGLSKLLQQYKVDNQGLELETPAVLASLPVPFLAATPAGLVIVTSIDNEKVDYLSQGHLEQMSFEAFSQAYSRKVLVAHTTSESCEPDYAAHRRAILFAYAKRMTLMAAVAFVAVYWFISNGLYREVSTLLLTVFNIIGLYFCYLLMGKMLKVHSVAADAVCGVLQRGGCDDVLATKASTFFGIFSWSEVGFTYFSVSLLAMLAEPAVLPWLAAINVCCLPFTLWSISYQKFVIKKWCTLCVSVQATLWALFLCYLGGGWLHGVFPLGGGFFVLVAIYAIVLLTLNRLSPYLEKNGK